ncbi:MAG: LysM peptidoglycan-binding domain-containing M23 family metallopeptidase [Deltaproteobacteria bacterium]|nr:LysM peptidoglycan-binding domain-containing M23 family metallopeptidase [Deltaproteobacteria bacterium]
MSKLNFCWSIILSTLILAGCSTNLASIRSSMPDVSNIKVAIEKSQKSKAPSDEEGAFHVVGQGETLEHICDVYGLDLKAVAKVNKLEVPFKLTGGATIFLPATALLSDIDSKGSHNSARPLVGSKDSQSRYLVAGAIRGLRHPNVPELRFPVPQGVLTSPFGFRWGSFHKGLDIAAPVGNPVLACADGRVVFTGSQKRFRRYGNTVLIEHGKGAYTYYAHLSGILVKPSQLIRRGQKIALVGNTGRSTGPHLHLEVRVANQMYNPLAYFSTKEMSGMRVAKRFSDSPMGPVLAHWKIPDLVSANLP